MNDLILKTITKMLLPFIQMYGVYVVLHGHVSPGGGFSGGAILGASLILYIIVFGLKQGEKKLPHDVSLFIESGGVAWYMIIGLVGIYVTGSYLSNQQAGFFMGEAGKLLSAGMIPLITIGVGAKVASTMITLFTTIVKEQKNGTH
jgi:multicomponent Na+:H+ antiporter subunit B